MININLFSEKRYIEVRIKTGLPLISASSHPSPLIDLTFLPSTRRIVENMPNGNPVRKGNLLPDSPGKPEEHSRRNCKIRALNGIKVKCNTRNVAKPTNTVALNVAECFQTFISSKDG